MCGSGSTHCAKARHGKLDFPLSREPSTKGAAVSLPTSEECNQAWAEGYKAGYGPHFGSIPPRPPLPAGEVDALAYFRKAGFARGETDRALHLAGKTGPQ